MTKNSQDCKKVSYKKKSVAEIERSSSLTGQFSTQEMVHSQLYSSLDCESLISENTEEVQSLGGNYQINDCEKDENIDSSSKFLPSDISIINNNECDDNKDPLSNGSDFYDFSSFFTQSENQRELNQERNNDEAKDEECIDQSKNDCEYDVSYSSKSICDDVKNKVDDTKYEGKNDVVCSSGELNSELFFFIRKECSEL